jgi:hypothetical protein
MARRPRPGRQAFYRFGVKRQIAIQRLAPYMLPAAQRAALRGRLAVFNEFDAEWHRYPDGFATGDDARRFAVLRAFAPNEHHSIRITGCDDVTKKCPVLALRVLKDMKIRDHDA